MNKYLKIYVVIFIILITFCMQDYNFIVKSEQIYFVFIIWFIYLFLESKFQLNKIKTANKKNKEILDNLLSHDFKNPILAQINALELLISGQAGKMEDYQLEILKQTLYSSRLVEEMLYSLISVSNIELNSYKFEFKKINLKNLVKSFLKKYEYIANSKNIKIKFYTDRRNNFIINADKALIERAVMNLISNSIYCSNENSNINIFADNAGDNLKFYIQAKILKTKISNEKLEKIFDKNVITDKKFRQIGVGLGLNLSKDIITYHGGQIYAKRIKTTKNFDILEFGFYLKTEATENLADYNSAAATALYKLI